METNNPVKITYYNARTQMLDNLINNNLPFTYSMVASDSNVKHFKEIIKYLSLHNYDFKSNPITITFENRVQYFNKQQIKDIKLMSDLINFEGGKLQIDDGDDNLWTVDNIIIANNKLDNAVEKINSMRVPDEDNRPLNNLEKLMMAYEICRSFVYHENDENKMHARTLTAVLNDGSDIVCLGYASLFKELCNRLNIKCYTHFCEAGNADMAGNQGNHVNNVVVVGKNIFYCDVCWDSRENKEDLTGHYNYFMLPYSDKSKINNYVETVEDLGNETTPFVNITHDKEVLNIPFKLKPNEPISAELKEQLASIRFKYDDVIHGVEYFDETFSDEEIKNVCGYLLDKLNEYDIDYSIPIDVLEKSLYNLNRASGCPKDIAEKVSKITILLNSAIATTKFAEGALNSLYEAGKQRNNNVEV